MDSNLKAVEEQLAALNMRFQKLENMLHMLMRGQPAVRAVAEAPQTNNYPNWNHAYPTQLKNETQLK